MKPTAAVDAAGRSPVWQVTYTHRGKSPVVLLASRDGYSTTKRWNFYPRPEQKSRESVLFANILRAAGNGKEIPQSYLRRLASGPPAPLRGPVSLPSQIERQALHKEVGRRRTVVVLGYEDYDYDPRTGYWSGYPVVIFRPGGVQGEIYAHEQDLDAAKALAKKLASPPTSQARRNACQNGKPLTPARLVGRADALRNEVDAKLYEFVNMARLVLTDKEEELLGQVVGSWTAFEDTWIKRHGY